MSFEAIDYDNNIVVGIRTLKKVHEWEGKMNGKSHTRSKSMRPQKSQCD